MKKGFKIHLYPNKEQEEKFFKHINCCRFIWNYMLELHINKYKNENITLHKFDMINICTKVKNNDFDFLKEVSVYSLHKKCMELDKAFDSYFKGINGYPKFKRKKEEKNTFPIRGEKTIFYGNEIQIPSVGHVKFKNRNHCDVTKFNKLWNPRISFINNKLIMSFEVDIDKQNIELTDNIIGIDLGIKELAVCSYNYKEIVFHNINKTKKIKNIERKIKHLDRIIQYKYKVNKSHSNSHNILKYNKIIKNSYYKLSCIRKAYVKYVVNEIISLRPKMVVMEDLDILGLIRKEKRKLSKKIQDQYLSLFIDFMKYKCELYGIEFVQVDRFYPSSQICSCCGSRAKILLSDRTYICKNCGNTIDRDFNAAINLMKYGMNIH